TTRDVIESTAFLNPDGTASVIAMNRTTEPQSYTIDAPSGSALAEVPAHSISTFTLDAKELA
ncbi:MAG TPA: glycoside hydrolase family 30 beta sandwich domain-containing protein, partial [Chthoniobacteraceae bacterium]|nr:glycoside hydrolase family 30 beta sandwich domain-containing protein [Chthoniobacteraceae bacterium]